MENVSIIAPAQTGRFVGLSTFANAGPLVEVKQQIGAMLEFMNALDVIADRENAARDAVGR